YSSYNFKVEVIDSDGNKTSESSSFSIEDTVTPDILSATITESISSGERLKTEVHSSDLSGIQQVSIELWTVENGDFVSKFDESVYSYGDQERERTTVDYLFGFENPLSSGDQYKARVTVTDETGLESYAESNTGVV